jgi:hypothetical protein
MGPTLEVFCLSPTRDARPVGRTGSPGTPTPGRLLENFTACTTRETRGRVRVSASTAAVHSPAGRRPSTKSGTLVTSCACPRPPTRMGSWNRETDSVREHTSGGPAREGCRPGLFSWSETCPGERLDTWDRHRLGCCPVARSGACLRTR